MRIRLLSVFVLISFRLTILAAGQTVDSERRLFAQTKGRADKGDPEAQLQLGTLYANGTGVARDPIKAVKWHRKAAQQGFPQAQFQLGLDYANGEGVKMDRVEAVHWFRAAAEQGCGQAQLELGTCYLEGRGVEQNGSEALRCFKQASNQGVAYADYEIGNCYVEGIGVAKDIEEGTRWIQQAAQKGVPAAQNALGAAYEKGDGVPKDFLQAYKWFALAAAQDDLHAADIRVNLAKLETQLSKDQIALAQRLAHEFKAGTNAATVTVDAPKAAGSSVSSTLPQSSSANDGSKTGLVTVKTDDNDGEVFVDGAFAGNAPAKLRLQEGLHVFEVRKSGFKPYRRELNVTDGCDLNLHANPEKE